MPIFYISLTIFAKAPFINLLDISSPYAFASSTTSFISALYGIFLYFISYTASFNKLKFTLEILSIFQSDVKELSTVLFISSACSFIPCMQSFIYSIASLLFFISILFLRPPYSPV